MIEVLFAAAVSLILGYLKYKQHQLEMTHDLYQLDHARRDKIEKELRDEIDELKLDRVAANHRISYLEEGINKMSGQLIALGYDPQFIWGGTNKD